MKLSICTIDGAPIVSVAGAVESHDAGQLYDVLVKAAAGTIGDGGTRLIVDLSGVHTLTHAGVRGLFVAAKLMKGARGEMRICGVGPKAEAFLKDLGFNHLLKCDPTLQASIESFSGAHVSEDETATDTGHRRSDCVPVDGWNDGRVLRFAAGRSATAIRT